MRQRGLALPSVLIALAIATTLSLSIVSTARRSTQSARTQRDLIVSTWVLKAGLKRGLEILLMPGHSMAQVLLDGEPASWSFAGRDLRIEIEAESRKVDLNLADIAAVQRAVVSVLDQHEAQPVLTSVAQARADGRLFTAVDQVLSPTLRFGTTAAHLRRVLTVFGGQRDLSHPNSQPPAPTGLDRPIYTIRAKLIEGGLERSRSLSIILNPTTRRYAMLAETAEPSTPASRQNR
jgi:hypothetical protein